MTVPTETTMPEWRRLLAVLGHIDDHLDEELSLAQLSAVAALSPFHFHRLFRARFGLGVHQYVQLLRLKRASYQLAFRQHRRIIDIALAGGYQNPESFTRAFRQLLGQTPRAFRQQPDWLPWSQQFDAIQTLRSQPMYHAVSAESMRESVRIVTTVDIPVAVVEHRGDPRLIGESIRRFIAWRRQHGWSPDKSATFNLLYDDPEDTAPADYRLDLCAAIRGPLAANDAGIVAKIIPGGRCALLRHVGDETGLAFAVRYLYSDWLPASGEALRDFPIYLQRVKFFPDVPENQAVTDIFLPLQARG